MRAQQVFFEALTLVLGDSSVVDRSAEISSYLDQLGVRIYTNHEVMELSPQMSVEMSKICELLSGPEDEQSAPRTLRPDGMITDASSLGPCIIEFDEEQHFSPSRLVTLEVAHDVFGARFDIHGYARYCSQRGFTYRFLKKCRISGLEPDMCTDPHAFLEALRGSVGMSSSRYIAPVAGFRFAGGRMAQRAYYDCLRDVVHQSNRGVTAGLKPIVRISLFEIEEAIGERFESSSESSIARAIERRISVLV